MKLNLTHTAMAAVAALVLSAAPLTAEARPHHGGGGWHHGSNGWRSGAYFGLGALTTAALLSRPAYYPAPSYYYPPPRYYAPRPVYYDPYYAPPAVVYERW